MAATAGTGDEPTGKVATPGVRRLADRIGRWRARRPVLTEVGLLAVLYVAYSVVRSFAGDEWVAARANALAILRVERVVGLDVERGLNGLLVRNEVASVAASVWYAAGHFVVTGLAMVALFRHRPALYPRLRNALVLATGGALVGYLLLPTAPPRLIGAPYVDVLAATSDYGWWGGGGVAPKGLTGMANELAAFPSMHAGWSLWVAVAAVLASTSWALRAGAVAYAAVSALDVVVTANHWTLDVVAGWAIVAVAVAVCCRHRSRRTAAARGRQATSPLAVGSGGDRPGPW